MVQDAAYCFEAVDAFDTAASAVQLEEPDFALYYRQKSSSFSEYNRDLFVKTWKIEGTDSVVLGPAAATYVSYESRLATKQPKYLSIGILPCDILWPWVAKKINDSVPAGGLYRSWVDDNLPSPGHQSSAQKFVDEHSQEYTECKSQKLFNEGMVNELNFFLSACGEDLVDYDEFGSVDPCP